MARNLEDEYWIERSLKFTQKEKKMPLLKHTVVEGTVP